MGANRVPPNDRSKETPAVARAESSAALFLRVLKNANLRRAEVGFGTSVVATSAWLSLLLVITYQKVGPVGPGLFVLLRSLVGAAASPGFAALAERWRREWVLAAGYGVRVLSGLAALAIVQGNGPVILLYLAAVVEGVGASAPYSIQYALLPWLADSPNQLVAANALSSMQEVAGVVLGGALVAVLLRWSSSAAVLIVITVLWAWAAATVFAIRGVKTKFSTGEPSKWSFLRELLSGIAYLRRASGPRAVVIALALPTLLLGMGQSFVSALALNLLGLGSTGPPFLVACLGMGGLIGGIAGLSLAGRRRLTPYVAVGLLLSALGPVIIAAAPDLAVTVVVLVAFGVGIALQTVATHSLLQRIVSVEFLGPVVGVTGLLSFVALGIGGIAAAGLDSWLGIRLTLLVTGLFALIAAGIVGLRLAPVDQADLEEENQRSVIEGTELFHPLSMAIRSQLARELVPLDVVEGSSVIQEGDRGDDFFIVESGLYAVLAHGREVAKLSKGDTFGEIALLLDSPRTATVQVEHRGRVWKLRREAFLAAVTGDPRCRDMAHDIAAERSRSVKEEG